MLTRQGFWSILLRLLAKCVQRRIQVDDRAGRAASIEILRGIAVALLGVAVAITLLAAASHAHNQAEQAVAINKRVWELRKELA